MIKVLIFPRCKSITKVTAAQIFSLFFVAAIPCGRAQSVPKLDSILVIFDSLQTAKCAAKTAEFSDSQPRLWPELLPSVGIGYAPTGATAKPRPTVSFSFASLLSAKAKNQERKAKRAAVAADCLYQSDAKRAGIIRLFRQAENLQNDIAEDERIFEKIEVPIFNYWKTKAENLEILPIEWLQVQRSHEQAREALRRRRVELADRVAEIFAEVLK